MGSREWGLHADESSCETSALSCEMGKLGEDATSGRSCVRIQMYNSFFFQMYNSKVKHRPKGGSPS